MNAKYTITHFRKDYPNNDACLHKIYTIRYKDLKTCPKCGNDANYKKVATRMCYYCPECYNQIHPMAGTIFEKSTTPLVDWFYAMYLFSQSKNGLSARELQRHIDVTYKTAFRMMHKIRNLLETDIELLEGIYELDETYIGGKNKNRHQDKKYTNCQGRSTVDKEAVFGLLNRDGKVVAYRVPDVSAETLMPIIEATIPKGSTVNTDEWKSYNGLAKANYNHKTVYHNRGQYADGDTTTNRVENYWSNVKRTLKGCYITVSPKYLQNYVNEVTYKYNNRGAKSLFNDLIAKV